ncbi:unnamed protein product [Meloidogyne enterolobii]|uniref:Uncharacterized protein n=1 Tax=Meloidogyne enterolobii TaxID=390850 RepID=A0ACB0ZS69_MELEN
MELLRQLISIRDHHYLPLSGHPHNHLILFSISTLKCIVSTFPINISLNHPFS